MNDTTEASQNGSDAHSELREQQLLLSHEADQLILDPTKTLAETLGFMVTRIRNVLKAWHVDIMFQYADGLRVEISSDPAEAGRFIPIERSISGLALSSLEPVMVNDLRNDPVLRDRYWLRAGMDPQASALPTSVLVAVITLDGQAIGVINVEALSDSRYERPHLKFVEDIARQVSMAITHAALFDEDKFRSATDRLLLEVTSGDSKGAAAMRGVLDHIVTALNSLTFVKPDAADILFADPQDADWLVVAHSTNNADIGLRVGIESSVCGEAFRLGQTVLLQRAIEHDFYRPVVAGMQCEMAIPIVLGGSDSRPIGVLNLESLRENAFSIVGRVLAERFARRVVNAVAMTKIRSDIDNTLQDQLMVLAADQVLNAVHRINNHVGSIRALVLDLLDDLESAGQIEPGDLAGRLEMIGNSADKALEIPDEMRKRIGTPAESVDVNAQVETGVAAVRIPKNIDLVVDLAQGLPGIPCTALDLVVENLLLNAVKAMRDQPGSLTVTTAFDRRQPREAFIVITVTDTGIGMTKKEVGRLFEPRQGRRRGSGLGFGMVWVRAWVRRAQGLIDVKSEPGAGTTVTIRFQIYEHQSDRIPKEEEP